MDYACFILHRESFVKIGNAITELFLFSLFPLLRGQQNIFSFELKKRSTQSKKHCELIDFHTHLTRLAVYNIPTRFFLAQSGNYSQNYREDHQGFKGVHLQHSSQSEI